MLSMAAGEVSFRRCGWEHFSLLQLKARPDGLWQILVMHIDSFETRIALSSSGCLEISWKPLRRAVNERNMTATSLACRTASSALWNHNSTSHRLHVLWVILRPANEDIGAVDRDAQPNVMVEVFQINILRHSLPS